MIFILLKTCFLWFIKQESIRKKFIYFLNISVRLDHVTLRSLKFVCNTFFFYRIRSRREFGLRKRNITAFTSTRESRRVRLRKRICGNRCRTRTPVWFRIVSSEFFCLFSVVLDLWELDPEQSVAPFEESVKDSYESRKNFTPCDFYQLAGCSFPSRLYPLNSYSDFSTGGELTAWSVTVCNIFRFQALRSRMRIFSLAAVRSRSNH